MPSDAQCAVVVGGVGYVGGRIASHLVQQGWSVLVTGRTLHRRLDIAAESLDVMADSTARLDEVLAGASAVINCVANNENRAVEDPEGAKRVAVEAASRIGAAVVRLRIPQMLQLSTVHVYGTLCGEIDEASPVQPNHPYALAHAAAESAVADATGASCRRLVVRLSNAIGPPIHPEVDRWTLLTNDLARTWATDGDLPLRSAGTGLRDFVTLEDVSRATHHLLMNPTPDDVVNVCSARTRSVLDVAQRMADVAERVSGVRPELRRLTAGNHSIEAPSYSISNARLLATGFRLHDRLDDELEALLRFARAHFGASR